MYIFSEISYIKLFISSVQSLSRVWLFATPWTVAHQAPLFMGILQARILGWVAMPSSRGSSQPRDWTQVSHTAGGFFTSWATGEAQEYWSGLPILSLVVQVKNPSTMQEIWVQSLGWEDPLGEGMSIHSSILAWRILMDREAWRATVHGVTKSWTRLSY